MPERDPTPQSIAAAVARAVEPIATLAPQDRQPAAELAAAAVGRAMLAALRERYPDTPQLAAQALPRLMLAAGVAASR